VVTGANSGLGLATAKAPEVVRSTRAVSTASPTRRGRSQRRWSGSTSCSTTPAWWRSRCSGRRRATKPSSAATTSGTPLTDHLLPALLAADHPRVVTTSSFMHRMSTMRWDDLDWRGGYRKWDAW